MLHQVYLSRFDNKAFSLNSDAHVRVNKNYIKCARYHMYHTQGKCHYPSTALYEQLGLFRYNFRHLSTESPFHLLLTDLGPPFYGSDQWWSIHHENCKVTMISTKYEKTNLLLLSFELSNNFFMYCNCS